MTSATAKRQKKFFTKEDGLISFNTEELREFFRSDDNWFHCSYYIDPKTANIILERRFSEGIQYLHLYSLEKKPNFFMFTKKSQVQTGYTREPQMMDVARMEVASRNKQTSIEFLIKEIMRKPQKHEKAGIDLAQLEENLRKALTEFQDVI